MEKREVDLIADGIRDELIAMAPRSPNKTEYEELVDKVASLHGHKVIRHGVDVDGNGFVEVADYN